MDFDFRLSKRVSILSSLESVRVRIGSRASLESIAAEIDTATAAIEEYGDGALQSDVPVSQSDVTYSAFRLLGVAISHLLRWVDALRRAEIDAERFKRAAVLAADDAAKLIDKGTSAALPESARDSVARAAGAILAVQNINDVRTAVESVMTVSVPFPFAELTDRHSSLSTDDAHGITDTQRVGPVAFLSFWINDAVVAESQLIQPEMLYDLRLHVRLSEWPQRWVAVEFVPMHVEPIDTLIVPQFRIEASTANTDGDAESSTARILSQYGRMVVGRPMDLLTRPLEVRYVAQGVELASGNGGTEQKVDILTQGQTRLSFRSYDLAKNPITGFRNIDRRILEVRDEARSYMLPDDELSDFLTLLAAIGSVAAQSIMDNLYPNRLTEKEFQNDLRQRLRAIPTIGGELEEHPRAAGGITDLSFRKIRIELKVQSDKLAILDHVRDQYGQQATQYVVGSNRRCGLLVLLDISPKDAAPGDAANDIALCAVAPLNGSGRALLIGVAIIRGCLSKPSGLSRRKKSK